MGHRGKGVEQARPQGGGGCRGAPAGQITTTGVALTLPRQVEYRPDGKTRAEAPTTTHGIAEPMGAKVHRGLLKRSPQSPSATAARRLPSSCRVQALLTIQGKEEWSSMTRSRPPGQHTTNSRSHLLAQRVPARGKHSRQEVRVGRVGVAPRISQTQTPCGLICHHERYAHEERHVCRKHAIVSDSTHAIETIPHPPLIACRAQIRSKLGRVTPSVRSYRGLRQRSRTPLDAPTLPQALRSDGVAPWASSPRLGSHLGSEKQLGAIGPTHHLQC